MTQDVIGGKLLAKGTYADGCVDNDEQGTFDFWWAEDNLKCSEIDNSDPVLGCDYAYDEPELYNTKVSCCNCGGGCRPGEPCVNPKEEAKRLYKIKKDAEDAAKAELEKKRLANEAELEK